MNRRVTSHAVRVRLRTRVFQLLVVLAAAACSAHDPITPVVTVPVDTAAPPLLREMRGMWVATVANIDWPSSNSLTAAQQQAQLVDIMSKGAAMGLNAIVFQVRPAADAVYASEIEPWASLLTGTQGNSPGYDPLAMAIQEAHLRGMELHAWINPFRAGNTADTAKLAANHIFNTRRDLVRVYGTHIWLDPGEPEAHDHTLRVVADLISRYDIDAIHMDDYFYPYVQTNSSGAIPFPDEETYQKYGGGMSLGDWRRDNVNRFIQRFYTEVRARDSTTKVGISPFGIWRPNNPPGVQGLDAYASIYADARKWLNEGWLDYMAPQLYWAISAPQQSFAGLFDWWLGQNTKGRHVWPGLAAYKVNNGTSGAYSLAEIPNQIELIRTRTGGTGNILYNTDWTLRRNNGVLSTTLQDGLYKTKALMPAYPWLGGSAPAAPTLSVTGNTINVLGTGARWWAIRMQTGGTWSTRIHFNTQRAIPITAETQRVLVQGVDHLGHLSAEAEWRRP